MRFYLLLEYWNSFKITVLEDQVARDTYVRFSGIIERIPYLLATTRVASSRIKTPYRFKALSTHVGIYIFGGLKQHIERSTITELSEGTYNCSVNDAARNITIAGRQIVCSQEKLT